ncbi:helix-turn-helix domain-containing protein [Streptomyces sclerotialus]|uniref:helix-turn-helix domain-containing protein n=1 Tax=Streptomyces sclerotialus TaxID=1957 RepID=UPI0004CC3C1E
MSRWQELPAPLDQRVRQLVVQLRGMKDRSGLSLAALAARTAYSKSSWERYLNGKKLPPRDAVEALARLCGADPTRSLALHEVAAAAWQEAHRPAPETPAAPPPGHQEAPAADGPPAPEGPPAPDGRPASEAVPAPQRRVRTLVVAGLTAALLAAAVALLVLRPWQGAPAGQAGVSGASAGAFRPTPGQTFGCEVGRTEAGTLSAGHSRSVEAVLAGGVGGWEVVEAQCLLRHHGYDPGTVDGIVGERTMRAAKRLQAASGLPADGIVGPDTWKVLRR